MNTGDEDKILDVQAIILATSSASELKVTCSQQGLLIEMNHTGRKRKSETGTQQPAGGGATAAAGAGARRSSTGTRVPSRLPTGLGPASSEERVRSDLSVPHLPRGK